MESKTQRFLMFCFLWSWIYSTVMFNDSLLCTVIKYYKRPFGIWDHIFGSFFPSILNMQNLHSWSFFHRLVSSFSSGFGGGLPPWNCGRFGPSRTSPRGGVRGGFPDFSLWNLPGLLWQGRAPSQPPQPNLYQLIRSKWWFQQIFCVIFHPDLWGDDPIWRTFFFKWIEMTYQTTQNAKKDGRRYMTIIFTSFFVFFVTRKLFLDWYMFNDPERMSYFSHYLGICCFLSSGWWGDLDLVFAG